MDTRRRILFVDDDTLVLSALRRLLSAYDSEWDMRFVDDARRALELLDEGSFDVLVTDMRMPGMSGAELLQFTYERHPSVVRIVLSGQVDREAALRLMPITHQFLHKPCDSVVLKAVLDRACRLQEVLDRDELRTLVAELKTLPRRPPVYGRLVAAAVDPGRGLAELAAIIEQDPELAAKTLRLVNHAYMTGEAPFQNIGEALAMLGAGRLRFYVLAAELFQAFVGKSQGDFSVDIVFEHSLAVGRVCVGLFGERGCTATDAFLAGLFHDIGLLVVCDGQEPYLLELLAQYEESGWELHQLEMEARGVSHAEIGGHLLSLLGLPYPAIEAAANHHAPERLEGDGATVATAVYLANLLVVEREHSAELVDDGMLARLGLTGYSAATLRDRAALVLETAG